MPEGAIKECIDTLFIIETIVRKHRQGYFANYNPKVTKVTTANADSVNITFTLGPNEDDDILSPHRFRF